MPYALQSKSYNGLTGPARAACVKLFVNQKWEMPEELTPRTAQAPPKVFTLWEAVQVYVNDESFKRLSRPDIYMTKSAQVMKFLGKSKPLKELWIPDLKLYRSHRT